MNKETKTKAGKKIQTEERCPECGDFLIEIRQSIRDQVRELVGAKSLVEDLLDRLQEVGLAICGREERLRRFKEVILGPPPRGKNVHIQENYRKKEQAIEEGFPDNLHRYIKSSEQTIEEMNKEIEGVIENGNIKISLECENCDYTRVE